MLICDDLVPKLNELNIDPKDYMYPESLKDSNPVYALYLQRIGAKFYKENGVTRYIDKNGYEQKIYHESVRGHL